LHHSSHHPIELLIGAPAPVVAVSRPWAATGLVVLLVAIAALSRWRRRRAFDEIVSAGPVPRLAAGPPPGSRGVAEPHAIEPDAIELDAIELDETGAAPSPLPAGSDQLPVAAESIPGAPPEGDRPDEVEWASSDEALEAIDLTDVAAEGSAPSDGLERLLEEHRRSTAELAAWVVSTVVAESDKARSDLESCRHEASAALRRASDLAESIVIAGGRRSEELLAVAAAHDAAAARRQDEAATVLLDARKRADELLAAAEAAAHELQAAAAEQVEQSRAILAAAEAERAALVAEVRAQLGEVLEVLEERIEATEGATQTTLQALLAAGVEERARFAYTLPGAGDEANGLIDLVANGHDHPNSNGNGQVPGLPAAGAADRS
jgi:hypothetical protein